MQVETSYRKFYISKVLADTTQMYENKIAELAKQLPDEHARFECPEEQLYLAKKFLSDHQNSKQVNFISNDKIG